MIKCVRGVVDVLDRGAERAVLDRLLAEVRGGRSGALVVVGEPGVGKSALLDWRVDSTPGVRVVRLAGIEAEGELPYAALHQLCRPLLEHLDRLPGPQSDALSTTFGLRPGLTPDALLVGLAVLSLLAEAARDRPLVCVIDDVQWTDAASAQVFGVVARRLQAESVLMLFSARERPAELRAVPELTVPGLPDTHARELLRSVITWPLDTRVREAVLAEARGNPLALLELPAGVSPMDLAGGFRLPGVLPLAGRIEDIFMRRIDGLPPGSRLLLLVAAADPTSDSALLWRAAHRLGLDFEAGAAAEDAGLLKIGLQVLFRHTLARSAAYRAASPADRRRVHTALAEATDVRLEPDRRAWHRAQAAAGPDEAVAAELEASAGRAQARGGLAAAAAFLERAAELTADPGRQADRRVAAARAKYQAGDPAAASALLEVAATGPRDELRTALMGLLAGQMAFASERSGDSPGMLMATAGRLEALDSGLARDTYLDALAAAVYAGRFAQSAGLRDVAVAARAAPPSTSSPRPADSLLDGLSVLYTDGYAAGVPLVRDAVSAFRAGGLAVGEELRWLWIACHSAHDIWDDEGWHALSTRYVALTREAGALSLLPIALSARIGMLLHAGDFAAATALVEELDTITAATGNNLPAYGTLAVAGWRGDEAEASSLAAAARGPIADRGEGMGLTLVQHSMSVLHNGLGRFTDALAAAEVATAPPHETGFVNWSLAELIEAAVRTGDRPRAQRALDRLTGTTTPSGTEWSLGIEARCRALLADDPEDLYREAIDRLGRSRGGVARARAHLLYGEWLRRRDRPDPARTELRAAHEQFVAIGAEAFSQRARAELLAIGDRVPRRVAPTAAELTEQELTIARRARDGRSNPEIGAELFLSARTVEWHLSKIYAKLGIKRRGELRSAWLSG